MLSIANINMDDCLLAGGVTSMQEFQSKFFPSVAHNDAVLQNAQAADPVKAAYCKYNDQVLQLVVSSLYISALFSGIIASWFAKRFGRKVFLFDSLAMHLCMVFLPPCNLIHGAVSKCCNQTLAIVPDCCTECSLGFMHIQLHGMSAQVHNIVQQSNFWCDKFDIL